MERLTAQEIATQWGVSLRYVQALCQKGRIEGIVKKGRDWMIPADALRPADGRTRAGRRTGEEETDKNIIMPRKTAFLHMSDLYQMPGKAEESIAALADHPGAQMLLEMEIAYSRGEIDRVYERAVVLMKNGIGFYSTLASGMLLALCAIWRGDLTLWRQAKLFMAEAPAQNDQERDIIALSITAVDSMLYDVSSFHKWFRMGRFEILPKDALSAVKVFYAKYLYATSYAVATRQAEFEGLQGMALMSVMPYCLEPMISQIMAEKSIVAEIYLRMIMATVYSNLGNEQQAVFHADRAIALAMPDRLYGILAEYCRVIYNLVEQRLTRVDPVAWERVRELYKNYDEGWVRLNNMARGKHFVTTLTHREREVAKLAAFGLKNGEIAEKMHMSLSGVKQMIASVSNKTGLPRDAFATII